MGEDVDAVCKIELAGCAVVAPVPLAVADDRAVDGEDERLAAGCLGSAQQRLGHAFAAQRVELKPVEGRPGARDVFHRGV